MEPSYKWSRSWSFQLCALFRSSDIIDNTNGLEQHFIPLLTRS